MSNVDILSLEDSRAFLLERAGDAGFPIVVLHGGGAGGSQLGWAHVLRTATRHDLEHLEAQLPDFEARLERDRQFHESESEREARRDTPVMSELEKLEQQRTAETIAAAEWRSSDIGIRTRTCDALERIADLLDSLPKK